MISTKLIYLLTRISTLVPGQLLIKIKKATLFFKVFFNIKNFEFKFLKFIILYTRGGGKNQAYLSAWEICTFTGVRLK